MRTLFLSLLMFACAPMVHAQNTAPKDMAGLRTSFASVVKDVAPAVVNISTKKVVRQQVSPFANDPFFQMFFGNAVPGITQDRVERSLGSGVILREDGLFVTNYHVVAEAQKILVSLANGREFNAVYIDGDRELDIAIMKIDTEGEKMPFATLGNSDALEVGDVVLAIGNPFGVGQSVSMGIVSALGRGNVGNAGPGDFIQTDAAINPGNSGGALIDSTGKVIGINSAIFTRSGGSNGIGFAIPANAIKNIVQSVIATGEVRRGWFGATGQDITQLLADKLELATPHGVLINEIANGSPANRAGLQVGDIIIGFNGVPVRNTDMLLSRVLTSPIGKPIPLVVSRAGQEVALTVRLTEPPKRDKSNQKILEGRHIMAGFVVEELSPALAQELNMNFNAKGVAVLQVPTRGVNLGLMPGDVIEEMNDLEIHSLQDLEAALVNHRSRTWHIVYTRQGRIFRTVIRT